MSLIYLLQISAVWLICYLFYLLWLRPENLPAAKRFFLVGAVLAGPLLPLLPGITLPLGNTVSGLSEIVAELETITVIGNGEARQGLVSPLRPRTFNWLSGLWLFGSVLSFFRLLGGWRQILVLLRKGEVIPSPAGYQLVHIPSGGSPFSYANYLFWPTDLDIEDQQWAAVKAHEEAHIKQGHTYDLLLVDLLSVLFWWNPLLYFYRKSLRLQHEYLADAAATQQQKSNVRDYARLLLQHQLVGWVPGPGHAFHHSYLKNRIIMLTQPKGASWKLLAILPLFVALLWACNEDSADITGVNIAETEAELAAQRNIGEEVVTGFEMIGGKRVYTAVEQMPIYGDCSAELTMGDTEEAQNCSNTKLLTDVYTNIKYPAVAREAGAEGLVVISFVVPANGGKATDFKIAKSTGKKETSVQKAEEDEVTVVGYDNTDPLQTANEKAAYDALDAAALETAMNLPQEWTAGQKDGQPVAVRFNLPIKFKMADCSDC